MQHRINQVLWLTVSILSLSWSGVHAEYLAYAVGDKLRIALPKRIDNIDAKYLLNLQWGEYAGSKARTGVLQVENNSSSSSFSISGPDGQSFSWDLENSDQVPVNGIESIVMDIMNQTGRFRLVERQLLDSVLQEQDLAASGRVAKPSGAKTGKILGAQYLVQVVITDYETNTSGKSGGGLGLLTKNVPLLGGLGLRSSKGRVGINFRLIDAETTEVIYTRQMESVIKESGLTVGAAAFGGAGALGGFFSSYAKTPIGQAVIAGINKGVYELVKQIGATPASGTIIKAAGKKVWLNIGVEDISVGDTLMVMSKGEELIDPDTGISLGSSDTEIGRVEVYRAEEKFSIADIVGLDGRLKRGDKVISTVRPPSVEFAPKWKNPRRGTF